VSTAPLRKRHTKLIEYLACTHRDYVSWFLTRPDVRDTLTPEGNGKAHEQDFSRYTQTDQALACRVQEL
jgi:hypothetical protein